MINLRASPAIAATSPGYYGNRCYISGRAVDLYADLISYQRVPVCDWRFKGSTLPPGPFDSRRAALCLLHDRQQDQDASCQRRADRRCAGAGRD